MFTKIAFDNQPLKKALFFTILQTHPFIYFSKTSPSPLTYLSLFFLLSSFSPPFFFSLSIQIPNSKLKKSKQKNNGKSCFNFEEKKRKEILLIKKKLRQRLVRVKSLNSPPSLTESSTRSSPPFPL